jgi:hypothetical protein
MLIVESAKLTGTSVGLGWVQAHEFTPDDPIKFQLRGSLHVVISMGRTGDGIDLIASGREILGRLHGEYYGNNEGGAFNSLKNAVEKIMKEFGSKWGEIEIAAASVVGDVVYSVGGGGGGVMILRDGSLATILESLTGQTVIASGYPKKGDKIILGTRAFFKNISQGVIKAALSSPSSADAVDLLAPVIHSLENSGDIGAIVMDFKAKTFLNESQISKPLSVEQKKFEIKISPKIKEWLNKFKFNLPQKNIYVRQETADEVSPQSKKMTFTIAIILLVLLGISIGFGIRQKNINNLKNKYQGILKQAENDIDQAISLASINLDKSRQLFADSEQKINQIDSMKVKDPGIEILRKKINESRAAILGEYLVKPDMFLDLTLLSSGFTGRAISYSGGQISIMDSTGSRIIGVDVSTKKSKVIAGPSVISSASDLASYEDRVFALETDGIYEVGGGSQKVINKTWSGDALIAAFAGNIYVLDKSGGMIYRYAGIGNSFGDKQNWLAAGTNVNFTNVRQIAIDGTIYTLYPNSKILKFSQGSPLNFNVKGAIPEIGNIDAISGGPDNTYVYLLDKAGGRVVVTDKKGVYKAQYADQLISSAINLVVSEVDKKIILLTGDKLYSIDIKN